MYLVWCHLSKRCRLHTPCDEEPSKLGKIRRHPHERLDVRHCMTSACGVCFPATADIHDITALIPTHCKNLKYPVLDPVFGKAPWYFFIWELGWRVWVDSLTGNRSAARAVSELSGCCREESLPLEDRKMHVKTGTGLNEWTFRLYICTQRKTMTHLDIPLNWSARLPRRDTAAEY